MELLQEIPMPHIEVDFPVVLEEEERIPADVARKTAAYDGYLNSPAYGKFKAAADLWTAAFFWSPEIDAPAPTTADYRRVLRDRTEPEVPGQAAELLNEFPAFHWPLRFPEIRARGGFDVIIGNPPWEQFENREQKWFAIRAPDIARLKGADRKVAIDSLLESSPGLHQNWRIYQDSNQRMAEYARNSGRFQGVSGKPNTYLLFTESFAAFVRSNGRAALVVKSALGIDKNAQGVFQSLVGRGQVDEFHDIVNMGPFSAYPAFPAVESRARFAVVALRGTSGCDEFAGTFKNWSIDEAITRPRQKFDTEKLRLLSPRTMSLTSFRRSAELSIAVEMHRNLPELGFDGGGENPWGLSYHTLFNATTASGAFHRREQLESTGWRLGDDMVFRVRRDLSVDRARATLFDDRREHDEALPLYEGQLINRHDHRFRTYQGYAGSNKYGKGPSLPETDADMKSDPDFEVEPRYWMRREVARARIDGVIGDNIMLGIRDIGSPWYQRTAKGAILPRVPATHTLPILALPAAKAIEFVAIFNSTAFDFLVRGHMPGAHAALTWMLEQIPAPLPGLDLRIRERAEKLSLTSWSVSSQFGTAPYGWDPEERYLLDVETDALIAHAYSLTRKQYETVLDSFGVFAKKQIAEHGRYKFKEDCLDAYGRLG